MPTALAAPGCSISTGQSSIKRPPGRRFCLRSTAASRHKAMRGSGPHRRTTSGWRPITWAPKRITGTATPGRRPTSARIVGPGGKASGGPRRNSGSSERVVRLTCTGGAASPSCTFDTAVQQANFVWGRAKDDVWAVGTEGAAYHFDGAAWTGLFRRNRSCTRLGLGTERRLGGWH